MANDLEVDGESLTATENLGGATQHGSASVSATGTFSYTHDGSETSFDTFAYEVCDGTGVLPGEGCATASVFITVTPVNDAPVALPQALLTEGATLLLITLTGTDPKNETLTFSLVGPNPNPLVGALGTLVQVPPSSATVTYTPSGGGDLTDSFGFRVTDPGGTFDETVVDINAPDPADDPEFTEFVVAKDIPCDAELAGDCLVPDLENPGQEVPAALEIESTETVVITLVAFADVEVDPLLVGNFAFTLVGPAPAGTVTSPVPSVPTATDLAPPVPDELFASVRTATVMYTAPSGMGVDSFDYQACADLDGDTFTTTSGECDTATVTIDFAPFVPPPAAAAPTAEDREVITEVNEEVEINLGEGGGEGSIDPCDAEFPPPECDDVGPRSVIGGKQPFREQGSSGRLVYFGGDNTSNQHSGSADDPPPNAGSDLAQNAVVWASGKSSPLIACVEDDGGGDFDTELNTYLAAGSSGLSCSVTFRPTPLGTELDTADLDTADFDAACGGARCDVIYVATVGGTASYADDLDAAMVNIENYVNSGGGLVSEPDVDTQMIWAPFGDQIGSTNQAGDALDRLAGSHPVFNTPNVVTEDDLRDWGSSFHSVFSQTGVLSAGFVELAEKETTGEPYIIARDNQPLPDLVVFDLTHNPAFPGSATEIDFTAVVKNIGIAAAGPSVLCFEIDGDCSVGSGETIFDVPSLGINETFEVQRSQGFPEILVDTMFTNTAVANFDTDDVVESDETNNTTIDNYIVTADSEPVIVATIVTLPASGTLLDSNGVAISMGQTLTNTMVTYVPAETGTFFFEYTLTNQSTSLTSAMAGIVDLTITIFLDECTKLGRPVGCTPQNP